MNQKILFVLWGGLFILCAGLGFIPDPQGVLSIVLTLASVLFFVPPFLLAVQGKQEKNAQLLRLLRNLSALSLGLTVLLLVANFFTVMAPELVGTVFYYILVIVSSPMVCSRYWALSLFLWASLLMVSMQEQRKLER